MSDKIPMTPDGRRKLEEELARLRSVERPKVLQQLQDARSHGDISENAEFEAAKDKQGWVEGRISEFEDKLARAVVIDPSTARSDKVVFGSHVTVQDLSSNKVVKYMMVGPEESDIKDGKLSVQAPLGRALLGKTPGESVEFETPGGIKAYKVVRIDVE